jgi:transcriptional regulator with XRE-family HTH domain
MGDNSMEKRKLLDVTIGTNMSKLRKQFNLTQREICSVVGVNISTYKHYELGDRMVPISVLQDLAKFYKVSTNYFFENMPELSDKESLELSNYAFRVANNTQRYIAIDLKNPTKGLDEIEALILGIFALRAFYYLAGGSRKRKDRITFGGIEAINLFKTLGDRQ